MDRRTLLKLAATTSILPFTSSSGAGKGLSELAVANITPFSGIAADQGPDTEVGAMLAIKHAAEDFGLKINYTRVDTESTPAIATRKMQQLSQAGARLFFGTGLSSEALVLSKEAERSGSIYLTSAGADELTGVDCSRATFRWATPTFGVTEQTVRAMITKYPNAKRWYTITPKYVFGEAFLANAKRIFDEEGAIHVGNSYHSLTEREFSGYIGNAVAAKPDVLLLLNFSTQAVQAIRQAVSFGLKEKMKILLAWSTGLDQMQSLSPAVTEGVYFGAQYWHSTKETRNLRLVRDAQSRFKKTPNSNIAAGYTLTYAFAQCAHNAGSSSAEDIRKQMERFAYDGLTGQESVREFDHEILKKYYLMRGKPQKLMIDADDFVEIIDSGISYLSREKSLCKL